MADLGLAGATAILRLDDHHTRLDLSAEQNRELDSILSLWRTVPQENAAPLRNDRQFLLDCLSSEDATVRAVALQRLQKLEEVRGGFRPAGPGRRPRPSRSNGRNATRPGPGRDDPTGAAAVAVWRVSDVGVVVSGVASWWISIARYRANSTTPPPPPQLPHSTQTPRFTPASGSPMPPPGRRRPTPGLRPAIGLRAAGGHERPHGRSARRTNLTGR